MEPSRGSLKTLAPGVLESFPFSERNSFSCADSDVESDMSGILPPFFLWATWPSENRS